MSCGPVFEERESNLVAAWLPDNSKIVIDGNLPKKKKIWPLK